MDRHYFIIQPDFSCCIGDYSYDNCSYFCDNDIIELEGYDDTPFHVPGIEQWRLEWETMNVCRICGERCYIDSDEWLRRGWALAQQLRQVLPDEIDLYFLKHDDRNLVQKVKYFSLSPDTTWIIGTTDRGVIIYEKDILEVAEFMPFDVPGLDDWYNEFDRHVDYNDTTADRDFDWATWYVKGLEFAKIIRRNLPKAVDVWYRSPYELRDVFPVKDLRVLENGAFKIGDFLNDK